MPQPPPNPEPRRSPREGIAEDPAARRRVGLASAELLAVVLAAVAALAGLVLWHLARRGRLIRRRLGSPRPIRWPELGRPDAAPRDPDRDDGDRPPDRIETPR